jgi:hypothetical protein
MTPEAQLAGFIEKYSQEIGRRAKAALKKMRGRLPGAIELVYDNYNALVIGFGPTERTSDAVFSIALYPRWVTLFFLNGKGLPDPDKLLKGTGVRVRHIVLEDDGTLDEPSVRALMQAALHRSDRQIDKNGSRQMIIKSISAKQRPRRPQE